MKQEGRGRILENLRIVGSLAAIAIVGILATGCGTTGGGGNTSPIQVRIWRVNQPIDTLKSTINKFVSDNNNAVSVTYTNKPLEGYELSALKSLAAKTGPDIWSLPNDWLGDHTLRIAPLPTDFFNQATDDPQIPNAVDAVKQLYPAGIADQLLSNDGKSVLGVPTNVDLLQLYYNPQILSDATQEYHDSLGNNVTDANYKPVQQLLSSAPTTWSDLTAMVKYLTQKNGSTVTRGAIAMGTADNVPNGNELLQLLMMQNGTKIISSDRTRTLFQVPQTLPAGGVVRPGQNALDFYTSFSQPGNANYSWNPSMPQALDAFAQGKVAMVIAFSDFDTALKQKYPRFKYSVTSVPQISPPTVQAGVDFIKFDVETVTKSADNYLAAWKMLHRYSNPDLIGSLADQAQLVTPYTAALKKMTAFPGPQVLQGQTVFKKDRAQFDGTFRQMIVDVSQNGISSSDAIDSASDTINTLLASSDE